MSLRILPVLLSAALLIPVSHPRAQNEEPFGPNIGPWRFTRAVDKADLVVCRAIYENGNVHVRIGRTSSGMNWINLPAKTPSGRVVGASLIAGGVQQAIVHPNTRSNGSRLWLEGVDLNMLGRVAQARSIEYRISNVFHEAVAIDGNGAAALRRLGECLAANAAAQSAPAAPRPAPVKARMLYPDYPGASQSCVVPVDGKTRRVRVAEGALLMLVNATSEAQCSIFLVSRQRIGVAGHPNLCVNVGAGAHRGNLYLEQCKDVSVTAWDITGTSTTSARVRATGGPFDNTCWTIPALANSNARFPVPVEPAECRRNAGQELKFFVE